jgi:sugar lactone lactonase YvrE
MSFAKLLAMACVSAAFCAPVFAAPTDIVIDDQKVFPESLGSTPDGTLYIGGSGTGRIYIAKPGQAKAEPWISKEDGDFHLVLGVLADKKSNTLWVCDNDTVAHSATLKTFALDTGKKLKAFAFPGGGLCNDIALKNGAAYITDTITGRVLELSSGASQLTVWYSNPADPSFDGLVWANDGKLYTNTYQSNHLIRIDVNSDGSAGKGTVLSTDLPLFQPDGMRLSTDGRILMIEGQGRPGAGLKEGRLDEVTVHGDSATIKVLQSGFELPAAVTAVGNTAWVLEAKFDYQRNADMKGKDPGTFHAYAVTVPPSK